MTKNNTDIQTPILKRIKEFQEKYFPNESEMGKTLKFKQSTLNGYFRDDRNPSFELIESILTNFSFVSAEWLLRGVGEMERQEEEINIIKIPDSNKYLVKRFEEVICELKDIKDEASKKDKKIKELAQEVSALRAEINKYSGYGIVTEPSPEIKKK